MPLTSAPRRGVSGSTARTVTRRGYAVDTLRSNVEAIVAPTPAGRDPAKVPVPLAFSYFPVPPKMPRVALTLDEPSVDCTAAPFIDTARVEPSAKLNVM